MPKQELWICTKLKLSRLDSWQMGPKPLLLKEQEHMCCSIHALWFVCLLLHACQPPNTCS